MVGCFPLTKFRCNFSILSDYFYFQITVLHERDNGFYGSILEFCESASKNAADVKNCKFPDGYEDPSWWNCYETSPVNLGLTCMNFI